MSTNLTIRCGGEQLAVRKPAGGFCFIPVMAILSAWFAYRRTIRLIDLRVWLACHELTARRFAALTRRQPRYDLGELQKLVGAISESSVRQAIRRLEKARLRKWSESRITFNPNPDAIFGLDEDFAMCCAKVKNHRRKVPVPRRLLRMLSATTSPTLIATAFGHLLRCMYYRKGTCRPDGRCKASWIANVFQVSTRNVQKARRILCDLKVIAQVHDTQFAMNRWGRKIIMNLAWGDDDDTPQRSNATRLESPHPKKDRNLSSRSEHIKPVRRNVADASKPKTRSASLAHVRREDLADGQRLLCLFGQSIAKAWCRNTECQKLDFFSAAARASRLGKANPCGLFIAMVKRQRWQDLSAEDEDQGRRMLRRLEECCSRDAISLSV